VSLRGSTHLYARTTSPQRRLQMAMIELGADPRARVLLAAKVARLGLDYVTDERDVLERAVDVATWWAEGNADLAGLDAAHRDALAAASRASLDDRCGWACLQAALALSDVGLEPMPDLAAKRARDLVGHLLDAMSWPDVGDETLRASLEENLHDGLDRLFDHTRAPLTKKR
jgi:hypothetical protein